MNFEHVRNKITSLAVESWTNHKPWLFAFAGSAALSIAIVSSAYSDYLAEKQKHDTKEIIKTITFPTEGSHYETLKSAKHIEGNVDVFISLTSEQSRMAYNQVNEHFKDSSANVNFHHLSQNDGWEDAAKAYHSLILLKPDIHLDKYFEFFIKKEPKADTLKSIKKLVINDGIDFTIFTQTFNSIEIIRKVNHDLEVSLERNIDFIPNIIVHNNKVIYFGLFDSYSDSLRLFNATSSKKSESNKSN